MEMRVSLAASVNSCMVFLVEMRGCGSAKVQEKYKAKSHIKRDEITYIEPDGSVC
jgi:serine kinase of HPr protein (carbohydrate metabolism regulator)